jgi:hypothetical protein
MAGGLASGNCSVHVKDHLNLMRVFRGGYNQHATYALSSNKILEKILRLMPW